MFSIPIFCGLVVTVVLLPSAYYKILRFVLLLLRQHLTDVEDPRFNVATLLLTGRRHGVGPILEI